LCRVEIVESDRLFDISGYLPERPSAVADAELGSDSQTTSNARPNPLKTRSWPTLSDGEKAKQVQACLENISADCSYADWKNILCSVASVLGAEGEDVVREWSENAPHRYDEDSFDSLWAWTVETFTDDDAEGDKTGPNMGSLVYHARKNPSFQLTSNTRAPSFKRKYFKKW
jgi:hypothetical protein